MTRLLAILVAFVGPALVLRLLGSLFARWMTTRGMTRVNYLGREIPTAGGLLLLAAAVPFHLAVTLIPADAGSVSKAPLALLLAVTAVGFGFLGYVDDRWGDRSVGGLKGHFRRLIIDRVVTTGAIKAVAGALLSFAMAAWLPHQGGIDLLLSSLLIALTANGLNLVDTRPVRATALFLAGTVVAASGFAISGDPIPVTMAVLPGAAVSWIRMERRRFGMLGDTGSNLLGGVLGLSLATSLETPAKVVTLCLLAGFHLFTEINSLNGWIERRPLLRSIDRWLQGDPAPAAKP